MTKQDIINRGNKLITEFMGTKREKSLWGNENDFLIGEKHGLLYANDLKYHEFWDWLMPVIEKLESMGYYISIERKQSLVDKKEVSCSCLFNNAIGHYSNSTHVSFIKFVWESVIDMIEAINYESNKN